MSKKILTFCAKPIWWLLRVIASRVFIIIFMLGLLIASHTVSIVAHATLTTLSVASRFVSSQAFQPKSIAGLRNQNAQLRNRAATQQRVVNANLQRVRTRTQRTAIANIASAGGEALPFVGIGVIAGATVYEVKMSCDNMHDLYEMQVAIDPTQASIEGRDMVCGLQVPTKNELWQSIKTAPGAAWDGAVDAAEGTADWASSLERPDFGGTWESAINAIGRWFD